jgi:GrpB-like predicted nucleotidyltransferase (UPF0157 family)
MPVQERCIEPYESAPVEVREHDPRAAAVAARLARLVQACRPGTPAEHVGSSAVSGLAGKGTIDLLVPAAESEIPAIAEALVGIGFQRQTIREAFPPTRPMLQGVFRHGGRAYRVHVHVVPASSPEVAALRGFRDALRADPELRREYAALKREIVTSGVTNSVAFSQAKHDYIVAALERLGHLQGQARP